MSEAASQLRMSPEAYLAWEAAQPYKHEYVAGEIYAMSDASDAHVTISGNLYIALRQGLRGTPCAGGWRGCMPASGTGERMFCTS